MHEDDVFYEMARDLSKRLRRRPLLAAEADEFVTDLYAAVVVAEAVEHVTAVLHPYVHDREALHAHLSRVLLPEVTDALGLVDLDDLAETDRA